MVHYQLPWASILKFPRFLRQSVWPELAGDESIRSGNDCPRASKVGCQYMSADACIALLKLEDVRNMSPSPAINRLIVVAHDENTTP